MFDWLIPSAYAQSGAAPATGGFGSMLILMLLMIAMLFFMSRSQNKRVKEHQALVDSLQRGDEIVTAGGIAGRVDDLQDAYLSLEIAPNVKIKVEKSAVSKLLPKGALKAL
jgi:preprotein translocase subunit YajC